MRVETHRFGDDGRIPNNPDRPLILYRGALPADGDLAAAFEERFARNGWSNGWRDGIFTYHHYHSNTHEVLGIARGRVTVRFGGDGGEAVTVEAGDAVVIPAGVGHRNEGATPDLLVIGAYPGGRSPDLNTGEVAERARALESIPRVPVPERDPVEGAGGAIARHWGAAG